MSGAIGVVKQRERVGEGGNAMSSLRNDERFRNVIEHIALTPRRSVGMTLTTTHRLRNQFANHLTAELRELLEPAAVIISEFVVVEPEQMQQRNV